MNKGLSTLLILAALVASAAAGRKPKPSKPTTTPAYVSIISPSNGAFIGAGPWLSSIAVTISGNTGFPTTVSMAGTCTGPISVSYSIAVATVPVAGTVTFTETITVQNGATISKKQKPGCTSYVYLSGVKQSKIRAITWAPGGAATGPTKPPKKNKKD